MTTDAAPRGPAPRSRRRRWPWLVLGAIVIAAVVAVSGALGSEPPAPSYVTETVRSTDLEEEVEADATVAYEEAAVHGLRSPADGIVTQLWLEESAAPVDLEPALAVDGQRITVLSAPQPLYRDLGEGNEGVDVAALERALDARGYDVGEIDDVFDADTAAAVNAWRDDQDLEQTGVFPLAGVMWRPEGAEVIDVPLRAGDPVQAGAEVAQVADTEAVEVTAAVDQADIAGIEIDDDATVELDAFDDPLAGTVTDLPNGPDDSGRFTVRVALSERPDTLMVGMTGTARVVIDVRRDVVVVPTGAVSGTGGSPSVRVLVDGEARERDVQLGLVTSAGAEITDGLTAGEAIIVGEDEG